MGRSLQLGSVAGIRIQVHWTFILIVGWVALTSLATRPSLIGAALNVGFILVLFGCVLLHELGHALAARLFGIMTQDITLLPIGGVARLERMPRKPIQELIVALAGPAVNVAIAALLLAILLPTVGTQGLAAVPLQSGGFLQQLLVINLMLVVFNMLPAFPLDGGRVLRALLAMVFNYATATRIAARCGQAAAVGLGLLGLANPFMLVIAAFIFFGAAAEARQVSMREEFGEFTVRDGMRRTFRAVPAQTSVRELASELLNGSEQDYPVVDDGALVGMLRRDVFLQALGRDPSAMVSDVMERDVPTVDESDTLVAVLDKVASQNGRLFPVTSAGRLTGLLDLQNVLAIARARINLRPSPARLDTFTSQQAAPNVTQLPYSAAGGIPPTPSAAGRPLSHSQPTT